MQDNVNTDITELQAEQVFREKRYRRLYELAYGYAPSQMLVDRSLDMFYQMELDLIDDLAEMIHETDELAEVCEVADIPAWMTAGAPNPQTYRRWLTTERI